MRAIYKKDGTLSKDAMNIINMVRIQAKDKKTVRLHLKEWAGSPRHLRLSDAKYYNTRAILDEFGVKYREGNDAPKGGVIGDYIEIVVDRRNKFWKV